MAEETKIVCKYIMKNKKTCQIIKYSRNQGLQTINYNIGE